MLGDLRLALRQLRRAPGFSLVVVLTLALGIGATTAVFTLVDALLVRPLPYPEPDRIVTLWSATTLPEGRARRDNHYNVSGPDFVDWRRNSRSFTDVALHRGGETGVVVGRVAETAGAATVSQGFFAALGVVPRSGRVWSDDEVASGGVVVVSDSFVRRHFSGDARRALAAEVKVMDRRARIIGVMPPGFRFPERTELWGPFDLATLASSYRSGHNYEVIARLRPGVTLPQAQAEMEGIAAGLARAYPASNRYKTARVIPLQALLVEGIADTLWLLFGAVALVLLIACANIANLLLARGVGRQHELAVRAALGAGRGRLARQLVTEILVLAALAGGLGLLAATWARAALVALAPDSVAADLASASDGGLARAVVFVALVSLAACLLVALFPIAQALRPALAPALRAGGRGSTGPRGRLRAALVVTQLAVSLVLLTGAGLLLDSFRRLTRVDPGYRTENVLVMTASHTGAGSGREQRAVGFFDELARRAAALPGVAAASYAGALPVDEIGSFGSYHIEGRAPLPQHLASRRQAVWRLVGPGYFETLGVPLRRGRAIDARDTALAPATVMINETMARASWPGESPLGHRIRIGWDRNDLWMTIVGVVADTRQGRLDRAISQELYVPVAQHPALARRLKIIARTTLDPPLLADSFQRLARDLDPEVPVQLTTAGTLVAQTLSAPQFRTLLIGLFAAAALLLAIIGVAGVMAGMVAERHAEIGLRMAVGAQPARILRQFLVRGLRLALLGLALGLAGALAAARVLEGLLYGVGPRDPFILGVVSALLLLAAVAASLWPAFRAARVSPMVALRQE
jgi:putative ABC transport system permease protein